MSTRALRKLEESKIKAETTAAATTEEHDSDEEVEVKENEPRKNLFDLLNEDDENEALDDPAGVDNNSEELAISGVKKKKKNKKKKNKKDSQKEKENGFDSVLEEFGYPNNNSVVSSLEDQDSKALFEFAGENELFRVEHRCLNPDHEMKRIFGSNISDPELRKVVNANQRRQAKNRNSMFNFGSKLVIPKQNWAHFGSTGLSMIKETTQSDSGATLYSFVHGPQYREAQFLFWEAVESHNPEVFMAILKDHPYHIDTLLQVSEIMVHNEDGAGARDLIARALYACEATFHPRFNLSQYNSRLDYAQQENRPFFIALFRHMSFLAKRGCSRTALEFCKLIYGLSPEKDPLGMLLIVDYLALMSKEYDYLFKLFKGLEGSKNLSLLPNFSFSTALGLFLKSEEFEDTAEESIHMADQMIQNALLKFPTLLMPLLDKCSVEPDKDVGANPIFGYDEQHKDSSGLKQLISLYVGRTKELWKEKNVMAWLERNVKTVLITLQSKEKQNMIYAFRDIRRTRFQGTPRNILRHILMSEVKDAVVGLPPELRDAPILSYDPLPPVDNRCRYERPKHDKPLLKSGVVGGFLRSLLPNFDPESAAVAQALEAEELEGAVGGGVGGGEGNDLQHSVRTLLNAMRDLLNNVQIEPAPREDAHMQDDNDNGDEDEFGMD